MSDELDKLLKKASDSQEDLQKRKIAEEKKAAILPAPPPATPKDDERYAVYRQLATGTMSAAEYVLWMGAAFFCLLMWTTTSDENEKFHWHGQNVYLLATYGTILLFAIRLILQELFLRLSFSTFRKWRQSLPFKLEGWEELVDKPHFGKTKYWLYECCVQFEIGDNYDQQQAQDALALLAKEFCLKANGKFYTPFGSESRRKWHFEQNKMSGSANGKIAKMLYCFLKKEMILLHDRYKQPIKINIIAKGGVDSVEQETSD
jgi:hypothetical protein